MYDNDLLVRHTLIMQCRMSQVGVIFILDSPIDYSYIFALKSPGGNGRETLTDLNPRIRERDDGGYCVLGVG